MALTPFEGLLGVKFLLGLSFFVQAPGEIPHRRVYYDPPEEVRLQTFLRVAYTYKKR